MFSQRNNPYCELLHKYLCTANVEIFFESANDLITFLQYFQENKFNR